MEPRYVHQREKETHHINGDYIYLHVGGSLTAWGVTQTKTRFKAAVIGGATHWEGMVMESGSPELEV